MRPVAAAVLLAAVFVGCVGKDGTGADAGDASVVAPGATIPDAGSIEGIVVDDSTSPLEGAIVGIVGLDVQSTTDATGSFAFANLAPGPYTVSAAKLGFSSAAKEVTVAANTASTGAILTLTPLPSDEPYQETTGPMSGYFECHIGSFTVQSCATNNFESTVFPNNKRFLYYSLTSENWETMWGEARWTPAAVGTASGMSVYPSYSKRYEDGNGGHWYCEADGQSPIWFRYDADETRSVCTSQGGMDPPAVMATNPLMMVADPGFADPFEGNVVPRILLQQKFELIITVFYGEPAPEEFSAFPDG